MLKQFTNPKVKGTVGVGKAIAYFTGKGMVVSLPLNDSQPYDLVVEMDGVLQKIQVKTSTSDQIALRTMGGNQSFHTAKLFNPMSCDYIYGMLNSGECWLIPTSQFTNKTTIKLTDKKYASYKIQ
jgi:hypothetical protein